MTAGLLYVLSDHSEAVSAKDFTDFYIRHVNELLANDGIDRAYRFEATDGKTPKNLVFYELESLEVLARAQLAPKHPEVDIHLTNEIEFIGHTYREESSKGALAASPTLLQVDALTPIDLDSFRSLTESLEKLPGWQRTGIYSLKGRQAVIKSTPTPLPGGPEYLALTWWSSADVFKTAEWSAYVEKMEQETREEYQPTRTFTLFSLHTHS